MKLRKLAESIILQSMEDLWDSDKRLESIDFFTGRDFRPLADLAGMKTDDKIQLMRMVKHIMRQTRKEHRGIFPRPADRARFSPRALSAAPHQGAAQGAEGKETSLLPCAAANDLEAKAN